MRLWKDNKLSGEFEMPTARVAELFEQSSWCAMPWPLARSVAAFLADPDGPIGAAWDPDDGSFEQLLDAIIDRRQDRGRS
ncbi:MAG: hypothetical protein GEV09_27960 [Pseudonocardiaceae bacterium]|nr:hypothetical protein [Pseudonocardiaceae bacterium]